MTVEQLRKVIGKTNNALHELNGRVKDLEDTLVMAKVDASKCRGELVSMLSLWESDPYKGARLAADNAETLSDVEIVAKLDAMRPTPLVS